MLDLIPGTADTEVDKREFLPSKSSLVNKWLEHSSTSDVIDLWVESGSTDRQLLILPKGGGDTWAVILKTEKEPASWRR